MIVSVIGLSKNAGKTSYLNWRLKNSTAKTIAVTTTGRDGEEIDLVTGTKKPKVGIPKNTYFTSFDNIYDLHPTQVKGIKKLPFRVIGKNLWLYKTLDNIETEVVGPSSLKDQEDLITIFESLGCDLILIDGSLDRKSICLSERITDIVLVIGAVAGNIDEIKAQAEKIKLYSDFSLSDISHHQYITYHLDGNIYETEIRSIYSNESFIIDIIKKNPDLIYFPGAITNSSWAKLKQTMSITPTKLIINHPINMNIKTAELKKLLHSRPLYARTPFPLTTIAVNSYSPYNNHLDAEFLRAEMQKLFTGKTVIDITEVY